MADFMSPEARSRVMSSIRSRNTSPELYVRRMVWAEGFRYRLHVRRLPGTPDLVLAQYRLAVFVHGCFWHQHGCLKGRPPSSNREYWDNKLDRNIARDAKNHSLLEDLGWRVVTVWECKLTEDTDRALKLLRSLRAHR
jgi:DNA mismatch endonuclease (patch repair protein)